MIEPRNATDETIRRASVCSNAGNRAQEGLGEKGLGPSWAAVRTLFEPGSRRRRRSDAARGGERAPYE